MSSSTTTTFSLSSSVTSGSLSSSSSSSSASVQTTTPSGGGGGGNGTNTGNNQDNGNNGNVANSASLYLYTFLATLVLLLGVSGAIVVRSLVLRRRHRRMIEEAIRNGTYIPPNILAGARGKVDLAKKPRMWEANVYRPSWTSHHSHTAISSIPDNHSGKEKEKGDGMGDGGAVGFDFGWADIFPVAASISATSPAGLGLGGIGSSTTTTSSASDSSPNSSSSSPSSTSDTGTGSRTTASSRLRAVGTMPTRAIGGAWRLISPAGRVRNSDSEDSSYPLSTTGGGAGMPGAGGGAGVHTQHPHPHQSLPTLETAQYTPTHLEVAVLIAMPGALAAAEHRAKMVEASGGGECEEDLPHVEVGMTEIIVPPSSSSSNSNSNSNSASTSSSSSSSAVGSRMGSIGRAGGIALGQDEEKS
ncbi:hypothetical protein D9757_012767 [Collybiopsis confluens]|uniref:Uncharacterized protein n=1 Tax=Collybiopsis confluens TaxID=2823264 RepID=A0A8H5GKZ3_9AGAR|nr:hypothetical protein D9757_012767 [Collybiopsis confluens]